MVRQVSGIIQPKMNECSERKTDRFSRQIIAVHFGKNIICKHTI